MPWMSAVFLELHDTITKDCSQFVEKVKPWSVSKVCYISPDEKD